MPEPASQSSRTSVLKSGNIRNLVLVCIAMTGVLISESMLLISVPLRSLELSASPALIGIIMSAPYLLPLALAIPIGDLVTRIGVKKVMVAGSLGMGIGPWFSILLPTISGLVVMQCIIGLAQILVVIASQSAVTGLGRGRSLERYVGWFSTCISGGQLVGPLLAGKLIDTVSMFWVFAVIGAIPVISVVASCLLAGLPATAQPGLRSGYRDQFDILCTNKGVQVALVVTVATMFALGVHAAFLPLYLEELTFSATLIGGLISLRALCSMLIRPYMAKAIRGLKGRMNTLIVCLFLVAMGIMWTGATSSVVMLAVLAIILGIGFGIAQPLTTVIVAEHVRPDQRASALGTRLMGNRSAQILAPLVLGSLSQLLGFTWAFFLAGVGLVGCLVVVITLSAAFEKAELRLQRE